MNSKVSWSPSHPGDVSELLQKTNVAHRRLKVCGQVSQAW